MQFVWLLALGLVIGTLGGTLGIGGGVLLVPALLWLLGTKDQHRVAGITLAVLSVPVTLPGVWQYFRLGRIDGDDLKIAALIAAGFAVGAFAGGWLQHYLPVPILRRGFGLLMVYIAVYYVVSSQSEAANAASGVCAVAVSWLGFLGLRALGRRHLPKPDLGRAIRDSQEHGRGEPDYHI